MIFQHPLALILLAAGASFTVATMAGLSLTKFGFPLPVGGRRIGCVDGLRGYLALAVLVHHFVIWVQDARFGRDWSPPESNLIANFGAGGVALFFMTTGLLFYPRIRGGLHGSSWLALYVTRAFRIIPLVAVSVTIVTAIVIARTGARPDLRYVKEAAEWITAWKETSLLDYPDSGRLNAYVLWSLWFEWIFYLAILPLCALAQSIIRGRAPTWTIPIAIMISSLVFSRSHFARDLMKYLPLFAIGMLAWEVQDRGWMRDRLRGPTAALLAIAALLFGLISEPTPYGWPQMAALGFFFAVVACGNGFGTVLQTKGALVLGECSYGVYLLHGIILDLLFVEGGPLLSGLSPTTIYALLPPMAAVVAVATSVSYMLVERPMIRLGARIARAATGIRVREPQVEVAP
jgi:peptidoglycan/LPS O-acetylase OafA/YrhL